MANQLYADEFYDKAARAALSAAIVSQKANVCPFVVRLAWHASGTYDTNSATGGSNGATMRFVPEIDDPANAGLTIAQDLLAPVQRAFPDLSIADVWTLAGCHAIQLMGGPAIPFTYGRTDDADGARCPAHGRLPDAKLGADHLREVFYRMGFNDRDIVALSGAHTVGSCHRLRSGFDGPWTSNPLKFDNEYFRNLLEKTWVIQPNSDPQQYMDAETGKLMMLPTDMCLIEDKNFLEIVKVYASDEKQFFEDFSYAFGRLIHLGCPMSKETSSPVVVLTPEKEFRDFAMHGSVERMQDVYSRGGGTLDVNSTEIHSRRTAMHKAAFFGHAHVIPYLFQVQASCNLQDVYGDTPLHDAARLGHANVVEALLLGGADATVKNLTGQTAFDVAQMNGKTKVMELLSA